MSWRDELNPEELELLDLFDKGYVPEEYKSRGRKYIVVRIPGTSTRRSLGPFDEEKWERVQELYRKWRLEQEEVGRDRTSRMVEETKPNMDEMAEKMAEKILDRLRPSIVELIREEIGSRQVVSVGKFVPEVSAAAKIKTRISLDPELIVYYTFLASLYKKLYHRTLTLEKWANIIIKEHCETCLKLTPAVIRGE